jgi:tRNA(Ile)-lysidine synthase
MVECGQRLFLRRRFEINLGGCLLAAGHCYYKGMKITLSSGRYVVAVSGGVDSVVLFDLLQRQPGMRLTIAHFDHGIRPDSGGDRMFVQALAQKHGLPFVYDTAHLGPGASEAVARQARYQFLEQVRRASRARAIVTAHHQDDLLETAVLNMLRGTGRKGLTSLQDRSDIRRPLLGYSKQAIMAYAKAQGLVWHEDVTNHDQAYRRNYVRHSILPKLTAEKRQRLLAILAKQLEINGQLDMLLTNYLHLQPIAQRLNRPAFSQLPHAVAKEVMASWLRANGLSNFDKKTIERATINAKVGRTGSLTELKGKSRLVIGVNDLSFRRG